MWLGSFAVQEIARPSESALESTTVSDDRRRSSQRTRAPAGVGRRRAVHGHRVASPAHYIVAQAPHRRSSRRPGEQEIGLQRRDPGSFGRTELRRRTEKSEDCRYAGPLVSIRATERRYRSRRTLAAERLRVGARPDGPKKRRASWALSPTRARRPPSAAAPMPSTTSTAAPMASSARGRSPGRRAGFAPAAVVAGGAGAPTEDVGVERADQPRQTLAIRGGEIGSREHFASVLLGWYSGGPAHRA